MATAAVPGGEVAAGAPQRRARGSHSPGAPAPATTAPPTLQGHILPCRPPVLSLSHRLWVTSGPHPRWLGTPARPPLTGIFSEAPAAQPWTCGPFDMAGGKAAVSVGGTQACRSQRPDLYPRQGQLIPRGRNAVTPSHPSCQGTPVEVSLPWQRRHGPEGPCWSGSSGPLARFQALEKQVDRQAGG